MGQLLDELEHEQEMTTKSMYKKIHESLKINAEDLKYLGE